jgi:hypothetical protein
MEEATMKDDYLTFEFRGTPVRVAPAFLANVVGLWGLMAWWAGKRRPGRPWPLRLLVGAVSALNLLAVDVGHALAHTISARRAGAPVDHVWLSADMPRTLYADDEVPPRVHCLRAVGGPIYSAVGLMLALVGRKLVPADSVWREELDLAALGHGLILGGSLAPLPLVDGGSLLKWTLVERGQSPEKADDLVRQAGLGTGAAALATGAALAAKRRWLPAVGLIAAGAVAIAAALEKIR